MAKVNLGDWGNKQPGVPDLGGAPPALAFQQPGIDQAAKALGESADKATAQQVFEQYQAYSEARAEQKQQEAEARAAQRQAERDAKQIAAGMRVLTKTIPDYRVPDSIRLAISPLPTSYAEVWDGFDRLRDLVESGRYRDVAATGRVT